MASAADPDQFGVIFDRHFDAIYRYMARRTSGDAAALTSETFCVAFSRRSSFDARALSALPWLYGIARNVIGNAQRSTYRLQRATSRVALERSADVSVETLTFDDSAQLDHLDAALAASLSRLADDDREALLLMVWEGLTYAQIASVTGVPVGTVRSRIHRARHQVRTSLEGNRHE